MQKHELTVTKTARYFTLGELNKQTKTIWFVLHGYAQTAESFLESLASLQKKNTFIIAPEGLSRFYWKDFISNPVASWMTRLDREEDIKDNLKYLDSLYYTILKDVNLKEMQINFLGFSQGTATLSRWLFEDKIKVNKVVFYAGELSPDIDISLSANFQNANIEFIYGTKDRFISHSKVDKLKDYFLSKNIAINTKSFEGKHEICKEGIQLFTS